MRRGWCVSDHEVVPDLLWDDVSSWFDPEIYGRLPDVHVPDTTAADWQAIFDLVRSKGWAYEYSIDGRLTRLPHRVEDVMGRQDKETVELKVWPARDVLAIFRLHGAAQIDFDVDLRELQGQQRLDVLCWFMRAVGRKVGKRVVMTPEGGHDLPLLGYDVDADRVVKFAEP